MKRIVILISGRGSNMEAIVRACAAERWPATVAAVIASRADAPGLAVAEALGVTTEVVDNRDHADRASFDAALVEAVDRHAPDVIAFAGFMRILGDAFIARYAGRMMNVHPSLLPAFVGMNTHARAIAAGCKLAGATVHFVTPQLDGGPIVAQAAVPILPGDDAARLAARVLEREHVIYPRALRWFIEGQLRIDESGVVTHAGGEPQGLL